MKLLIQPGDGVSALLDAIHRAETSVEIVIFRFDYVAIEEALTAAVKRGVRVHALIAHVNGSSAEALRKLELRLLGAGVTVARTDTDLARYHAKYLIIDRAELFVLAFNFTHQDIEKSRSFGLITKNRTLVRAAVALFEADATRQPYKPETNSLIVSPVNARKQIAAFLKGAKEELAIYDPRLSDRNMIRLLRERMEAGVKLRIIGHTSEKEQRLPVCGLNIRLHTRTIIRDRKAVFVGSQSLRQLELDGRREVGVICKDRAVVNAILDVFEKDWATSSQQVASVEELKPVQKVAKKIAKAFTTELPSIAPVLDNVVKEIAQDGVEVKVAAEDLEHTVREAVKDAVKSVVQEVIEEKLKTTASDA